MINQKLKNLYNDLGVVTEIKRARKCMREAQRERGKGGVMMWSRTLTK